MKHLLEIWQKIINEDIDITVLPTKANVEKYYSSYYQNLDSAIESLETMKYLFKRSGNGKFDLLKFEELIKLLESARDDETLKDDVEAY